MASLYDLLTLLIVGFIKQVIVGANHIVCQLFLKQIILHQYLIILLQNNMGLKQRFEYTASSRFYLEERLARAPWITKLPFPIQVLTRVETYDHNSVVLEWLSNGV
ncbi:MAG: hypothetical protein AB1489_30600 [Acidobacteriota bacterium]